MNVCLMSHQRNFYSENKQLFFSYTQWTRSKEHPDLWALSSGCLLSC